jgi:3-oxoacyl-[acyl-carrier-protein] synthase III
VAASEKIRNVLVIGADALSKFVDWTDRGTCILFGDAAGAVLVQVFVISHVISYILTLSSQIFYVPFGWPSFE